MTETDSKPMTRRERWVETAKVWMPSRQRIATIYMVLSYGYAVTMAFVLTTFAFAYDLPVVVWFWLIILAASVGVHAIGDAHAVRAKVRAIPQFAEVKIPDPTDVFNHATGQRYKGWEVGYGPYFISMYDDNMVRLDYDGNSLEPMTDLEAREFAAAMFAAAIESNKQRHAEPEEELFS